MAAKESGVGSKTLPDADAVSAESDEEWHMPVDPLLVLPSELAGSVERTRFVWASGGVPEVT